MPKRKKGERSLLFEGGFLTSTASGSQNPDMKADAVLLKVSKEGTKKSRQQ